MWIKQKVVEYGFFGSWNYEYVTDVFKLVIFGVGEDYLLELLFMPVPPDASY